MWGEVTSVVRLFWAVKGGRIMGIAVCWVVARIVSYGVNVCYVSMIMKMGNNGEIRKIVVSVGVSFAG